MEFNRVILIVLDGVGIGELPDAAKFNDLGSNTLGNLATAVGGLHLPNLEKFGLGNIAPLLGVAPANPTIASFGRMAELSAGKDTTVGHWELAGIISTRPFPVYPTGFPKNIIDQFINETGVKGILGNIPASGTEIIAQLGVEHLRTGYPIVYTSADSVFQIAAHEAVIPIDEQYRFCEIARLILQGEHGVARVIARPFLGEPGKFERTERRKDFSLPPPHPTILDYLKEAGYTVFGIGKIEDIFANQGLTKSLHSHGNKECIETTLDAIKQSFSGLIFVNFVDFDMLWGHRNDCAGFYKGLQYFDTKLPEIMGTMKSTDVLMLVADHGNDPTTPSTDHSREYSPLLVYSPSLSGNVNLGTRDAFADIAATIAEMLQIKENIAGKSFLKQLKR
ncbi:MAG: phosphopentomutase [bacterium]|nr:phosphopentomutase [bacterium]